MGFFELPRKRKTAGAVDFVAAAAAADAATGWEWSSPSTEVARKTRRTTAWFGIVCVGVHEYVRKIEGAVRQPLSRVYAPQFDKGAIEANRSSSFPGERKATTSTCLLVLVADGLNGRR